MVLFPKDYVKLVLTGEPTVEVTDASGSFLMDVGEAHLVRQDVRSVRPAQETSSRRTSTSPATSWATCGPGLPITWACGRASRSSGGAGDQPAGGIGNGVYRAGVVSATIGTSGVVYAVTDKVIADRQRRAALAFCHSAPNTWSFFGCTLAAGRLLQVAARHRSSPTRRRRWRPRARTSTT